MTFLEIERIIRKDGWRLDRKKGSHHHYVHASKPGVVTIPRHGGQDIAPQVIRYILLQAGLK